MPPKADPYNTPVHRRIDVVLFAVVFAIVAILLSTSAHAQTPALITYFNFNDANLVSDAPSIRPSTIDNITGLTPSFPVNEGSILNLAPTDPITTTTGNQPLRLTFADNGNNPRSFQFTVNTTNLTNVSLNYATRTSIAGITQTISYSINGGSTFVTVGTFTPTTAYQVTPTFNLPAAVDNQASVIIRITLTPSKGFSGAYNDFDNIQVKAVPEPSTVGAAILGVLGVGWHQRRRLRKAGQLLGFGRKPVA